MTKRTTPSWDSNDQTLKTIKLMMMMMSYKHSKKMSYSHKCVILIKLHPHTSSSPTLHPKLFLSLISIVFIKSNFISPNKILLNKNNIGYVTVKTGNYATNSLAQLKNLQ